MPISVRCLRTSFFAQLVEGAAADLVAHQGPVDGDEAAVDFFQVVDGAQQGGLAGAGGPDDHGHAARLHRQRDSFEDFGGAEGLADFGDFHEAAGCAGGSGGSAGGGDCGD